MDYLDLPPVTRASGVIKLPGSKSISNRTLLLAALAAGETRITDLLDSDDTKVMLAALKALGVGLVKQGEDWVVSGVGGIFPVKQAELFMGNAGTAIRPLTAALALSKRRRCGLDGVSSTAGTGGSTGSSAESNLGGIFFTLEVSLAPLSTALLDCK